MIKKKIYGLLLVLSLFFVACNTVDNGIQKVQLGMSRQTVVGVLGSDFKVMSMAQVEEGNLEILRYTTYMVKNGRNVPSYYYLHFLNGKLVELNHEEDAGPLYPVRPVFPHRN